MKLEDLQNIFEIQSIDNLIKTELDLINNEENRISHIESLKCKAKEELDEFRLNLDKKSTERKSLEGELFDIDTKLNSTNSHIENAKNQEQVEALEKELSILIPKKEELETEILEILELEESFESTITEKEKYIDGVEETLNEVGIEVDNFKKAKEKIIDGYELRISNLFSITDNSLADLYKKVRDKSRFQQPISLLTNNCCGKCRFQLDSMIVSKVETLKDCDLCPSCGRIVISAQVRSIK